MSVLRHMMKLCGLFIDLPVAPRKAEELSHMLPAAASTNEFCTTGIRVLLGVQAIFFDLRTRCGAGVLVAELALVELLSTPSPIDENSMMECVALTQGAIGNEHTLQIELEDSAVDDEVDVSQLFFLGADKVDHAASHLELGRFCACLRQWKELLTSVKFQPYTSITRNKLARSEAAAELDKFNVAVKQYAAKERIRKCLLKFPPENLVSGLLSQLLALSEQDLNTATITLQCGKIFKDTYQVLQQAAIEINEDPSSVGLVRDFVSGYLYFDPAKCYSSDRAIVEQAKLDYKALGRLVGLTILHSCSLPICFPTTVYKVLLGYSVGMSDLLILRPTLARSLAALDEAALQEYRLAFARTEDGHFAGPHSDGGDRVDSHNRLAFIQSVLKYYFCCSTGNDIDNPMYQFFIGIQHMCPRTLFNGFTPVTLQYLVEGSPPIVCEAWQRHAVTYVRNASDEAAAAMFWETVGTLDQYERMRLLSFVTGSGTVLSRSGSFEDLSPPFTVVIGSHLSVDAHPISLPHLHMLIIPCYASTDELRAKLLTIIGDADGDHSLT
jgi:hypothetical protein